jgi:multidrug efflux pump subunit AcrA (membrane-fusion protein)
LIASIQYHLKRAFVSVWTNPAMKFSEYLKPALATSFLVLLGTGWYWFEHRTGPDGKETTSRALVIVTKSVRSCFSDLVRVTGFVVPRREAVAGVEQEGLRVTDIMVREGETVTENQELARLAALSAQGGAANNAQRTLSLRAPAAGLITQVNAIVGAPASPQAGPMFRIAINNEIDLDAEVPAVHMTKLNQGANARISRIGAPDIPGRVRLVLPQIDRSTQLGHVRITMTGNPSLKIGMFAQASIDARLSCGVAIPRTAIDHLTVQVVKGNIVETRKVRVGLVSDTSTEILEGLDVDEIVVADAGSSLHDGDQIKTVFADEFERMRAR